MNALEAFRRETGLEPTKVQIEAATKWGGLNDADTIASIPEQIRRMTVDTIKTYGVVPDVRHVAPDVNLQRWDLAKKGSWTTGIRAQWIARRMGYRRPVPLHHVHPIVFWYANYLDRAPDALGFAHWAGEIEKKPLSKVRREFLAEAQRRGETVYRGEG